MLVQTPVNFIFLNSFSPYVYGIVNDNVIIMALRRRGLEVLAPVNHNVFHYSVSLVNANAIVIVKGDANSKW